MKNIYQKWNDISEDARILLISNLTTELSVLRAQVKITQEELAGAIGISRQTYSQIESRMSWSTYLSLLFFYSSKESTAKLLAVLNIYPNKYLRREIE